MSRAKRDKNAGERPRPIRLSMPTNPRPEPPLPVLIECEMCHREVPSRETMTIGGRLLCFGCVSGWFDSDEDSEDD